MVKWLSKVGWDPMGITLRSKLSLYIPRIPSDTFAFSLDQTIGHHDSAQPCHTGPSDYQDAPSDSVQIILPRSRSVSSSSSTASASLLLLILIVFHDNESMAPPFFFPMLPPCQGHSHPKLSVAQGAGSKPSADKIQPTAHRYPTTGNTLVWFPGH